jgi:hypothetical protein
MKVKISETVEVTDEQRVELANMLDGREGKRQATREECRHFIWKHGADWALMLTRAQDYQEDLIGGDDELELLL